MEIDVQSSLSMSTETLKSLVGLLQESNVKYDALEEEHRLLKRRYKTLEEGLIRLKFSLLCENCCKKSGEICGACSER